MKKHINHFTKYSKNKYHRFVYLFRGALNKLMLKINFLYNLCAKFCLISVNPKNQCKCLCFVSLVFSLFHYCYEN